MSVAQIRDGTANLQPFPKGVSGNPGGRPKGLVRRIREETRDGDELVEYMLEVLRDTGASRRDRMEAATWLASRGFGRPGQAIESTVDERVTVEELAQLPARGA